MRASPLLILKFMENQLGSSCLFPKDSKSLQVLQEIQKDLEARQIYPEQHGGRILFVNDIDWTKKGKSPGCILNSAC